VQELALTPPALEAACEFVGVEDVGELGLAVAAISAEPLLAADVIRS